MPHLSLPDCELYFEVHGSGPPLLFAHGLGGSHLSWWQQVPRFAQSFTCITFAQRGFHPSRCTVNTDPRWFESDLAALIDHLDLHEVRFVAQSMGGWSCLEYALHHPENVRALVLSATVGTLLHPEIEQLGEALPDVTEALLARGIHPACGERMAHEQPELHFLYRRLDALSSATVDKPAVTQALIELCSRSPNDIRALRVPVLCVVGEEDAIFPPRASEVFASLVDGGRRTTIPRCGHSTYWERAPMFNDVVLEFLLNRNRKVC